MNPKIGYLIHTEYHLLMALNDCRTRHAELQSDSIYFVLKRKAKSNRLKQDIVFDFLPYNIAIFDFDIHLNKRLTLTDRTQLQTILDLGFTELNFFQEQDPMTLILVHHYKNSGAAIHLHQDGLKPYVAHSIRFSPELIRNNINQNIWIKKNGFEVPDYFSFLHCKKYGFVKGIDKLFLTFPGAYINWNKLPIEKTDVELTPDFIEILKQVFLWDDDLMEHKDGVIFFMNQPMRDDGSFEVNMLHRLSEKYPRHKIYIKNHPSTSDVKRMAYKSLPQVIVLDSKIPAELFISQLTNSIILSVCSTSMFIDNKKCKFYYSFEVVENNSIERLKKYKVINPTTHVKSVKSIEEIVF